VGVAELLAEARDQAVHSARLDVQRVAARIVWAWIFTIPAAALVAASCFYVFSLLGGF
jgi:phosphate/sulfate permease